MRVVQRGGRCQGGRSLATLSGWLEVFGSLIACFIDLRLCDQVHGVAFLLLGVLLRLRSWGRLRFIRLLLLRLGCVLTLILVLSIWLLHRLWNYKRCERISSKIWSRRRAATLSGKGRRRDCSRIGLSSCYQGWVYRWSLEDIEIGGVILNDVVGCCGLLW